MAQGWRLTAGGWRLAAGGSQLAARESVAHFCSSGVSCVSVSDKVGMGMSENETHVESTHFNTSRVQTVCDNERYGVQGAGYVIGVDTLNPAVSTGTAKRKSGVQCGLWSAGATRWDSENFEVLVDNVDCVGLGFLMDNSDSGDSGSLTGMRCAVVSRSPGIILTTTTIFFDKQRLTALHAIGRLDFDTRRMVVEMAGLARSYPNPKQYSLWSNRSLH